MKNKSVVLTIGLFALFAILIFTTPFLENSTSTLLWMLFFLIIFAIILIWIILSIIKTPKKDLIEKFKKQPKILQILDIIFIICLIYEIILMAYGLHLNYIISTLMLFIICINGIYNLKN